MCKMLPKEKKSLSSCWKIRVIYNFSGFKTTIVPRNDEKIDHFSEKRSGRSFWIEDCSVWFSGRLVSQDDIVFAILAGINVLKSIVKLANVPFSKHFISVLY